MLEPKNQLPKELKKLLIFNVRAKEPLMNTFVEVDIVIVR